MVIIVTRTIQDPTELLYNTRDVKLFNSLEELTQELEKMPLDITTLITTSDIFTHDIKKSCNMYFDILEDRFIAVRDTLHLVSTRTSPEVTFLKFRDKDLNIKEVELTQENLINIVQGKLSLEDKSINSFRVYAYKKDEYVKHTEEKERQVKAVRQEELLKNTTVSDIEQPKHKVLDIKADRSTKMVSFLYSSTSRRQAIEFGVLYSEIVSRYGKTIIIEDSPYYLITAHYADKSKSEVKMINIIDYLQNTDEYIDQIKNDDKTRLYVFSFVGANTETIQQMDQFFYKQVIYKTLDGIIDYIIFTGSAKDAHIGNPVAILPTDLVEILMSIEDLPIKLDQFRFICINDSSVMELQLQSSLVINEVLSKLLKENIKAELIELKSLKGGALENDLYLFDRSY